MPTRTPKKAALSDVELQALQDTVRERKSRARRSPADERAAGEAEVKAKIAEMPPAERVIATRIHEIVTSTAPDLVPRTFYGMPAWARDGKVICFFQSATKYKVRYNTFGFQPDAKLDEGDYWPVGFALTRLTPAIERQIAASVRKAAG